MMIKVYLFYGNMSQKEMKGYNWIVCNIMQGFHGQGKVRENWFFSRSGNFKKGQGQRNFENKLKSGNFITKDNWRTAGGIQ